MFRLFLMAPFWVYFLLAIGLALLTEQMVADQRQLILDKAAALEQPMPDMVDLSDFNKDEDTHLAREIHVTGWLNAEYNKRLIKKKNGVTRSERFLIVLFGNDDTATTKIARAAFVLTEKQKDRFFDDSDDRFNFLLSPNGLRFAVNGRVNSSTVQSSQAKDSMKDDGLTLSENFAFITPYWNGREAALAPKPQNAAGTRQFGHGLAVILALVGAFKYRRRAVIADQMTRMSDPARQHMMNATAPVQSTSRLASAAPLRTPQLKRQSALADPAPTAHAAEPSKRKRMPHWAVGLVIVIALSLILPSGYVGMLFPLLILGAWLFIAKKSLDGLGAIASGAASGLSGLFGGGAQAQKKPNPFDRLS